MFLSILHRMTPPREHTGKRGRPLFTVQEDERFTRELWTAFKDTARANNEAPIGALRRLVEQYVRTHGQEHTP